LAFNSKEFYSSLSVRSILFWRHAFGPFGGLSTRQLVLPAPHGKKERKTERKKLAHLK